MSEAPEIAELHASGSNAWAEELAVILHDCVAGGASVHFMWPFDMAQSRAYWADIVRALGERRLRLFGASKGGLLLGTVQLWLDGPCNQAHRGEVRKLLVHRSARRLGLARALMNHVENEARRAGLVLLTLDTVSESPAERLYRSLDWTAVGRIPRFAKNPDGSFCDTTVFYKNVN